MEYVYKNWIDLDNSIEDILNFKKIINLKCNLTIDFFKTLSLDGERGEEYLIDAAKTSAVAAGSRPVILFSGGIDSQLAVLAFKKAKVDVDIIFFDFKNDLNIHERDTVKEFADKNSINIIYEKFDIVNFLNRENNIYGDKYKCASPHFNTHLKFVDICKKSGYTGCIVGGRPIKVFKNTKLQVDINLNQNWSYIKYSKFNNFSIVDFLLFYPNLSWYLFFKNLELFDKQLDSYLRRIRIYESTGVNLIPQCLTFPGNTGSGYTGFELVKNLYYQLYNNPETFEIKFRTPLSKKYLPKAEPAHLLNIDEEVKDYISEKINKYV